ncbi:MAG: hypothetical protein WBA10_09250 [Elainellaceae cyanobacterium]
MNLPLVFDLALGLIFVFLILSLLASEIQELITTLLQWRAEHLKKSIEILVSGGREKLKRGGKNTDTDGDGLDSDLSGIQFADKLYKNPILRSLNQEAKGPLATAFRSISYFFSEISQSVFGRRNIFGDMRSGPSFIPAASFAAALLEELNLDQITHQQSCKLLGRVVVNRLQLLRSLVSSLNTSPQYDLLLAGVESVEQRLNTIRADCSGRRISFNTAIDDIINQCLDTLDGFEVILQDDPEEIQLSLQRQLPHLRQAIAFKEKEPTIVESVELILSESDHIPSHLRNTLVALAKEVDAVADAATGRVEVFENRVSTWFSRSMDRASGVYKRNARGIAILIGCTIAVATNTDTFYMVNRLSKDSVLRESITQTANQLAARPAGETGGVSAEQLQEVSDAVNAALEELPLPIGWNPTITQAQSFQAGQWRVPILRRIAGWLITGIAISMGSSFWYSLLGRIVRVRNTGDVPSDSRSAD